MSFYLKYRPQRVADLDQESVRKVFETVLKSGTYAHAYLLTGPKGTGKTSSARIFAKILNCESNRQVKAGTLAEPCGICLSCLDITAGVSLCVVEMDAASNRGIDDIRTLKDRVGLAPSGGVKTVYIIDEVHMLTSEAFNALLKTLEEPPDHAVFVLCTTEPHKVPATIISRCVHLSLKKASLSELLHSLKKVVKGEKLIIDEAVLGQIAARAEGSFRDGMKLLEQAASQGASITLDTVNEITGFGPLYNPDAYIAALLQKDAPAAFADLAHKESGGIDFQVFATRVVEELRRQFVAAVLERQPHAQALGDLLTVLMKAIPFIKYAPIPQLPLELTAAEWSGSSDKKPSAKSPPKTLSVKITSSPATAVPSPAMAAPPVKTLPELNEEKEPEIEQKSQAPSNLKLEMVSGKWIEMLKIVKPKNHSLEALLKAARPTEVDNGWLTIEVFYTFHKEQLEQERHRRLVEGVLTEVCGEPVKLKFALGQRVQKVLNNASTMVANVTGSVEDEELAKAAEEIFG